MSENYSVYQFFPDGSHEQVRESVGAEEAVYAAHHYCNSVGAVAGVTRRVIIVDGGDSVVFEWLFGQGVVYPTPDMRRAHEREYGKGRLNS